MALPKIDQITQFDQQGIAILQKILDEIRTNVPPLRYTDVMPTLSTVKTRELIVYDDGAGTKRIYLRTGKDNIGYITLT